MLGVAGGHGRAARVEHDRDVLPVALVRLPRVRRRRDDGAPEVERLEEPVLDDDARAAPVDGAVHGRRPHDEAAVALLGSPARAPAVQPRTSSRVGVSPGRGGGERPVRAADEGVARREERIDRDRRIALRGMEDEDGKVAAQERRVRRNGSPCAGGHRRRERRGQPDHDRCRSEHL